MSTYLQFSIHIPAIFFRKKYSRTRALSLYACFDSGCLIRWDEMKQPCSQKKEHSLLVLPFVNASLNFATKFFDMLTKLQFKHP